MNSFFNFDTDVVYAPGISCVYNQLFDGVFATPWKAYPFRQSNLNFNLYDKSEVVIENFFKGETTLTSTLYTNSQQFLRENGKLVEYDILAIESRWLSHGNLFEGLDWKNLAVRLEPFSNKRLIFLDCQYPHYGYLQNINLLRELSAEELQRQHISQMIRHRFLKILTKFTHFRYVSIDALAAYHGYQNSCMDQPDHYTPEFRDEFKNLFKTHSDEKIMNNVRSFVFIEETVSRQESEIEFIEGLHHSFKSGEIILKLKVRFKSKDPLLCDKEILLIWQSLVDGNISYRQNFTLDKVGIIRPIINSSDENNNKIVLKSFDDSVKISTFGRYKFTVIQ